MQKYISSWHERSRVHTPQFLLCMLKDCTYTIKTLESHMNKQHSTLTRHLSHDMKHSGLCGDVISPKKAS